MKTKTKTKSMDLRRAFKASVLRKAKKMAADYRIVLEKNERLGFIGSSVELPTVFADALATINAYIPTGEFESLSKDELTKMTAEFQALKAEAATAVSALSSITEF